MKQSSSGTVFFGVSIVTVLVDEIAFDSMPTDVESSLLSEELVVATVATVARAVVVDFGMSMSCLVIVVSMTMLLREVLFFYLFFFAKKKRGEEHLKKMYTYSDIRIPRE